MAPTFEEIKLFVAPFEGNIPNMYVDTEGYVTVGIGNMLPDVRAARLLGFVNRTTKNAASADEKSADFSAVSDPAQGQGGSLVQAIYRSWISPMVR